MDMTLQVEDQYLKGTFLFDYSGGEGLLSSLEERLSKELRAITDKLTGQLRVCILSAERPFRTDSGEPDD